MTKRVTKTEVRDQLKVLHDKGVAPMKEALLANDGAKVVEALEDLEDAAEVLRELIEDRYDEHFVDEEEVAVAAPGGVEVIEGVVVPGEEEEEEEEEDED